MPRFFVIVRMVCFLALLFFAPEAAPASESAAPDDLFSGFDDDSPAMPEQPEEADRPENGFLSHFSGYAKLGTTVNIAHDAPGPDETDWRGLSRLRAELQLETDFRMKGWKFFASGKGFYDFAYALNGRANYPSQVLDEYESEVELRELYFQGALCKAEDLKAGRQIVVWGRSDNIRVADVLNPLDSREPGLTDIEDLRLPLAMTRLDLYRREWNLSLIAVHEHRFDRNPPFGHDFYPAPRQGPPETKPASTLENTEWAAELKGMFSGWDISFYAAKVFNDAATFVPADLPVQNHDKIFMTGAAMNAAWGDFLYIIEAAHFRGLRFMNDYDGEYSRTDLLAGLEYKGLTDTAITIDYAVRHLHGFAPVLEGSPEFPQKNDIQAALRITREFMNDSLALTGYFAFFGERFRDGGIQRITAEYELSDGWSVTAGAVLYQSGSGIMENMGDNDRIFTELRYDF